MKLVLLLPFLAAGLSFSAAPDPNAVANRAFGGLQPRVSPDGATVAVSYQGAICTLPVDGGVLTRLSRGEGWDTEPAWTPDGAGIVFFGGPGFGGGTLQMMAVENAVPIKLPRPARGSGSLWVHPDGARILGKFSMAEGGQALAWYDLNSGNLTRIEGVADSWAARLRGVHALSADGQWIYIAEHRDVEGEQSGNQGPQAWLRRLPVRGGTPETIVEWPARIYAIHPDAEGTGVFIATDFGAPHNDVWHVPLIDPGRDARKLTHGQADEDAPAISRDGSTLIYCDNTEGATALVRHDLASGERRALSIQSIDFREPAGTLRLRVMDRDEGLPAVARVSVRRIGGKFHFPTGSMYRFTAGLGHFYCRGEALLQVPAGDYEILTFRGPEYRVARTEISISPGAQMDALLSLERWVHAAKEGWYSGENHIHANYGYGSWYNTPQTILDQCEGEDLNVANLVVANSDGDGVFDREFFRGRLDPHSKPGTLLWWNEEFRSTIWGHMTLFHLQSLVEPIFTGFKGTTNPWDAPTNADVALRARAQGGVASYTHPTSNLLDLYAAPYAAKGLPVDVAVGAVEMLDVMGTVYEQSLALWYRLLNCGFALPAAAGTDVFLNRVASSPPGWGRVYVHLPDGLDYLKWTEGLRSGRSFVSNGPMIEMTVDGHLAGDTIKLDSPAKVRLQGRARSQFPLDGLEVIVDGKVAALGTLASDRLSGSIDAEIPVHRSGWIALRAAGPAVKHWPGNYGVRAHTNPVYLDVAGHPAEVRAEAEYFLQWIDRLEADLMRRGQIPAGELDHVKSHLTLARNVYRARLRR